MTQDKKAKPKKKGPRGKVHILDDWCKGCSFCVQFCPRHILEISDKFNVKGYHPPHVTDPERCTACEMCSMMCPEFAIYIEKLNADKKDKNKK